jgi:hypothetical protein
VRRPVTDNLTAADRELVTRARELTRVDAPVDLRHYLRRHGHVLNSRMPPARDTASDEYVFMTGFYDAQDLLEQLADLAERLAGGPAG